MIDRVRAFNRTYTSEFGFLERNYLRSGLSLPEIRVLYEIAHGDLNSGREIARLLRTDEGYVSRTIKKFEDAGLIARERDATDKRRILLQLTGQGAARMAELEAASRQEMIGVLDAVPPASRDAVDRSMSALRHVLAGISDQVVLRSLESGDLGWVVGAQGAAYARDEGYDMGFEILVARLTADIAERVISGRARAWIAEAEADRLGCIFRDHEDEQTARLRMFFVEPRARGIGLGRRLIEACIQDAREAGYQKMVLWTHESHEAACALYAKSGFKVTSSETCIEFGVPSVSQNWEMTL